MRSYLIVCDSSNSLINQSRKAKRLVNPPLSNSVSHQYAPDLILPIFDKTAFSRVKDGINLSIPEKQAVLYSLSPLSNRVFFIAKQIPALLHGRLKSGNLFLDNFKTFICSFTVNNFFCCYHIK